MNGPPPAPEVWRGGVNAWECDEMGHMNVRFHLLKAWEALGGLARLLQLPDAWRAGAASTLAVREQHMRFLREAHAGASLSATGAVLRVGEQDADLQVILRHEDGAPASTFTLRVEHVTGDGRPFPWPARARHAAEALRRVPEPAAAPRSLAFGAPPASAASLARADALGLLTIGRGVLDPSGCDAHGRLRPDEVVGRVSDGVGALVRPIREAAVAHAPEVTRVGGAVLEYRLLMLEPARAGDHLELRSGLAEVGERVSRVAHWLLDPVSGRAWATSEAVVVTFDLDARKIVPIAPAAREALAPRVVAEMAL